MRGFLTHLGDMAQPWVCQPSPRVALNHSMTIGYELSNFWPHTCIPLLQGKQMMAVSPISIPKRIYKTLANLRTGIVLLILVVIASAVGTFILQRPATEADKLARAYSPATLLWLDRLGLTDVFHASWFMTLMGLVSLSIIFVSLDRFPNAWRFYARPYRKTDSHFRSALPNKVELPIRNAEG